MASGQGLSGDHPTTAYDISPMKSNDQFTSETMSSTRSEYGSDNSSRHSQANRPVADKEAFIQPNQSKQHWQSNMSPAERAKKLADEMDKSLEQRRASAGEGDKMLKIGGKKEYKLD
ncbi:uncharacterized protein B0P05DRAFT_540746 [Gilbertella persicaria]|nr:uncharacterized protein B0P05DRAFT_540746 [Gilbertella persicaria]KAI8080295.1 hypothetical protein B0P05DRAFT_540746 [Gilbertella persicaria]